MMLRRGAILTTIVNKPQPLLTWFELLAVSLYYVDITQYSFAILFNWSALCSYALELQLRVGSTRGIKHLFNFLTVF